MRPVITPAESARLDAETTVPMATLMERAGLGVAIAASRMGAGYGSRVIVLAGPGNNGGDGYVAARHLRRRGVDVSVRSLGYPTGDSSVRRADAIAAIHAGVTIRDLGDPEPCDLIIDALFGAGFHGALPDRVVPWVGHGAPVLAVDLPSGLDGLDGTAGGPAFRAERTVALHALKTGHLVGRGPELSGEIEVVDIGLSGERPEWLLCEDADAPAPPRPRGAHKWSAGSLVIVGGSEGLAGAPMLAARSALAFGAGAVRVLVPGGVQSQAAAMDAGVMTAGIGRGPVFGVAQVGDVLEAAGRFDAMVLGPGLGTGVDQFVAGVMSGWAKPLVLDADGLDAVAANGSLPRPAPTVLTPHAGEFSRLTGGPATPAAAAAFAAVSGAVVLLKGAPTFVMGTERWVIASGGSELATIGTGDVLGGMIGALIARGLDPQTAARSAAHRHGLAGRSLATVTTVTASALAGEIGRFAW